MINFLYCNVNNYIIFSMYICTHTISMYPTKYNMYVAGDDIYFSVFQNLYFFLFELG